MTKPPRLIPLLRLRYYTPARDCRGGSIVRIDNDKRNHRFRATYVSGAWLRVHLPPETTGIEKNQKSLIHWLTRTLPDQSSIIGRLLARQLSARNAVRYLGVEVDDAIVISEGVDL